MVSSTSRSARPDQASSSPRNRNSAGLRAPATRQTRPEGAPGGQRAEDHRPQRGEPHPARGEDQIAAGGGWEVPGGAERPAGADHRPRPCLAQGPGDRADRPDRVHQQARPAAAGSPLTEIATSPTPGTASMVNWPGSNGGSGAPAGSRISVTLSRVSRGASGHPVGDRQHRLRGPGARRCPGPGGGRACWPGPCWPGPCGPRPCGPRLPGPGQCGASGLPYRSRSRDRVACRRCTQAWNRVSASA